MVLWPKGTNKLDILGHPYGNGCTVSPTARAGDTREGRSLAGNHFAVLPTWEPMVLALALALLTARR